MTADSLLTVRIAPWPTLAETGVATVEFFEPGCFASVDASAVELKLTHEDEVLGRGLTIAELADGCYMTFAIEPSELGRLFLRVSARRLVAGRPFAASVATRTGSIGVIFERASAVSLSDTGVWIPGAKPPDWVAPLWDRDTRLIGIVRADVAHVAMVEVGACAGTTVVSALPSAQAAREVDARDSLTRF